MSDIHFRNISIPVFKIFVNFLNNFELFFKIEVEILVLKFISLPFNFFEKHCKSSAEQFKKKKKNPRLFY
jgi:hypothetical protein